MNPLRIYWLVKFDDNLKIGDKLKCVEGDVMGIDYDYLDENFNVKKFVTDIQDEFETKARLRDNMCNSILYITDQSKTILGMMIINKRKK